MPFGICVFCHKWLQPYSGGAVSKSVRKRVHSLTGKRLPVRAQAHFSCIRNISSKPISRPRTRAAAQQPLPTLPKAGKRRRTNAELLTGDCCQHICCASPILIAIMVIGPSAWCTIACLVVFYLLACRLSMCLFVRLLTALLFDCFIRKSALRLWQHWRAVQG